MDSKAPHFAAARASSTIPAGSVTALSNGNAVNIALAKKAQIVSRRQVRRGLLTRG